MKNPLLTALVLPFAISACTISSRIPDLTDADNGAPTSLRTGTAVSGTLSAVGSASLEFIPEEPTPLSGFGGIGRRFVPPVFSSDGGVSFCRSYEKIAHPPRIKAAVFNVTQRDSSVSQLYLISLDIVAVTGDLTKKIYQKIAAGGSATEPALSNTVVLATHTHSGPAGLTENGLWSAFVCDRYNSRLSESYLQSVGRVIEKAAAARQDIASIETSVTQHPELLRSRMDGVGSDTQARVVTFRTHDGFAALSLVQLAVHPTFYGTRDLTLSADLVGPLELALRAAAPNGEVFLMQTAVGNMDAAMNGANPVQWAEKLASEILAGEKHISTNLNFMSTAGSAVLPKAEINWEACQAEYARPFVNLPVLNSLPHEFPFAIWKIDGTPHVFLSGEWTTHAAAGIEKTLAEKSATASTPKVFSLANEYTAYHVDYTDFSKKTLESCSSVYGSHSTELIGTAIKNHAWPDGF